MCRETQSDEITPTSCSAQSIQTDTQSNNEGVIQDANSESDSANSGQATERALPIWENTNFNEPLEPSLDDIDNESKETQKKRALSSRHKTSRLFGPLGSLYKLSMVNRCYGCVDFARSI